MDAHELKALQSKLTQELNYNAELKQKAAEYNKACAESHARIKELRREIEEVGLNPEPVVSEHALLRYIERVKGVSLDSIREEILDEKTVRSIKFAKNCSINRGNYIMVVKNNVVVTIKE